ncbi:unnamed protein product, partial [Staurois parvus]
KLLSRHHLAVPLALHRTGFPRARNLSPSLLFTRAPDGGRWTWSRLRPGCGP